MTSTLREMRTAIAFALGEKRFWVVFFMMWALFSFIGPFNTFDTMTLPKRALYWMATMLGATIISTVIIGFVFGLARNIARNPAVPIMIGSFCAILPVALYVGAVMPWFVPLRLPLTELVFSTAPVSLSFGVITSLLLNRETDRPEPAPRQDENALLQRLPPEKRAPVKYMSMEDHYVRVTTEAGTELLLMRMGDAMDLLGPDTDGLQIHRSHWVSRTHVANTRREKGQPLVIMDDGKELPVSRTYRASAKEADII